MILQIETKIAKEQPKAMMDYIPRKMWTFKLWKEMIHMRHDIE